MDTANLYHALGALVQDQPDVDDRNALMRWLGRAQAVVERVNPLWAGEIRIASMASIRRDPWAVVETTNAVLFRALAYVELDAPVDVQGSFIQAGNELDALAGTSKVFNLATRVLRIVDPYMSDVILTDFAILVDEGVAVELLSDRGTVKPSFSPAVARFHKQFDHARPLEARLTVAHQLHDRLIIVDGREVFTVTQSLKDLAKRSHASIIRVDRELADLKVAAYDAHWQSASLLT